jgi:bacterioferritin-associated ferredoxin
MNEKCNVVYYSSNTSYEKDYVKVPIWFKNDADPKYICYCNKVTEEQIVDAVTNKNAKDMKDIIRITGAMKNGKCLINNPTGECCGTTIQEIINKALERKLL